MLESFLSDGAEIRLVLRLLMGAVLAWGIGAFYRRARPAEELDRIFVPLTLGTIVLIAVVRDSVAVSLGLVGALSIVRLRTAIKQIDDLLFVLLCVAVGLALGAGQIILGPLAVFVILAFSWFSSAVPGRTYERTWLVSARGEEFGSALERLWSVAPELTLQRMERGNGSVAVHALATVDTGGEESLLPRLRSSFPRMEWSMEALDDVL